MRVEVARMFDLKKVSILILALLITVGVSLRFDKLAEHFTHYDSVFMATDILKAKSPQFKQYLLERAYDTSRPAYDQLYMRTIRQLNDEPKLRPLLDLALKLAPVLIVPASSTNPPLQYFFIAPLIHEDQSYREILFWGRFSSFVFSILCFVLVLMISRKAYAKNYLPVALIATTLLVFSWQHIIYAKQIYTYSIGVFCCLAMIGLFLKLLTEVSPSWLRWSGIITALFAYSTYQMIFLIPAFYLVLFIVYFLEKNKEKMFLLVKNAIFYLILILPALWYIMVRYPDAGVTTYNAGPQQEYVFNLALQQGVLAKIGYAIKFYIFNFFEVMQINLAFVPVSSLVYTIAAVFMIVFFLYGVWCMLTDKENRVRLYLSWLLLAIIFFWFGLIFLGKLTLSPTRITLIYLPVILFFVSDGVVSFLNNILKNNENKKLLTLMILIVFMSIGFFYYYPQQMNQRLDPIEEKQFKQLISDYKVDTIIAFNYSLNVNLMNSVRPYVNYYEEDIPIHSQYQKGWPFKRIMFFSTRTKFDKAVFDNMRAMINADPELKNKFKYRYNDYKIVFRKDIDSDTEIEINNKNKNGSNDLYLVILERR